MVLLLEVGNSFDTDVVGRLKLRSPVSSWKIMTVFRITFVFFSQIIVQTMIAFVSFTRGRDITFPFRS